MSEPFRVGITPDTPNREGKLILDDLGLTLLDQAEGVEWEELPKNGKELRAEHVRGYDALMVFGSRVTAATLENVERLAVVARYGVGYDTVDVDACTRSGVLLTITPDGVRRPMASSYIAFMLALSHKLMDKDRVTRAGRWEEKFSHMGMGLTGRVLGMVGLGNIGREVLALARPFEMRHLAYDPYVSEKEATAAGAELVDLETLLSTSDIVCICCLLNDETRHLINAERLALMKETSYLISAARGPIVDQRALTAALSEGRIQGAALDTFDPEPPAPDEPILTLDNVIVTSHVMPYTDQFVRGIGESASRAILDVAAGRIPQYVVNRSVEDDRRLQEKLRRYSERLTRT